MVKRSLLNLLMEFTWPKVGGKMTYSKKLVMEIFRRILFWTKYFFIMLFDTLNCIDFHVHCLNIRVFTPWDQLSDNQNIWFLSSTTDFSVQKEASFVNHKKTRLFGNYCPWIIFRPFPTATGVCFRFRISSAFSLFAWDPRRLAPSLRIFGSKCTNKIFRVIDLWTIITFCWM